MQAGGPSEQRLNIYASDLERDLVIVLDELADRFKPAGPATVVRVELHYDAADGRFVSAYTTLKTTRRMLGTSPAEATKGRAGEPG